MPYEVLRRRGVVIEELPDRPTFDTEAAARAWAEEHADLFPFGSTAMEGMRLNLPFDRMDERELAADQAEVARRSRLTPEERAAEGHQPSLLFGGSAVFNTIAG